MKRIEIAQYIAVGATCLVVISFILAKITGANFFVADGTWRYGRNGFLFLRRLWNSSEDVRKDSKMGLADTAISI